MSYSKTIMKWFFVLAVFTGVFVSFNDGTNWQSLQLNLPVVPIHDLVVKDDDLVAATHGRSFWILDDLTPLHQLDEKVATIEDILIQSKSRSNQDPLNYPIKLDNKIAALAGVVASADARPNDQSYELFQELAAKADAEVAKLKAVLETDIPALNAMLKEAGIPHIIVR